MDLQVVSKGIHRLLLIFLRSSLPQQIAKDQHSSVHTSLSGIGVATLLLLGTYIASRFSTQCLVWQVAQQGRHDRFPHPQRGFPPPGTYANALYEHSIVRKG